MTVLFVIVVVLAIGFGVALLGWLCAFLYAIASEKIG